MVLLIILAFAAVLTPAPCTADSFSLDEAWFASVARAESLVSAAASRGCADSTDHVAVVDQIRVGVHVLGSIVLASVETDSAIAGPFVLASPPEAQARRHRFLHATGVIAAVASLGQLVASVVGVNPQTRSVLAYVGGAAAGIGGVAGAWKGRPLSPRAHDTFERTRALDLEIDLRVSIRESEHAAESLWRELRDMAYDSCATDTEIVRLARRYTNAMQEASVLMDHRVARTLAIARSCGELPELAADSRQRCRTLANHLDAVSIACRERSWLLERSRKITLDFLVLADRP